ncbi:MAG: TatD family hydrolase [Cyclobacteriaceae bacterium]|nr:MAG: TatD family hydrolase [Cyclobacteriaceae bacterium]
MIDTHAHIYLKQFEKDLDAVIEKCGVAGVTEIMMPNIDHTTIDDMMEVETRYNGVCTAMIGLHPCSVDRGFEKELYLVEEWLNKRSFIAVGEIGTDLYWDKSNFKYQQEAFKIQVKWAFERKLPIVIHCRESLDQTLDLLEPMVRPGCRGVFHCFSGDNEQAERIISMGLMLGIGGVVTFKNSGLDEVLAAVDPKHLVLETDSPYLAPVPHRGKRNDPGFLPLIRDKLAAIYERQPEEIDHITTNNARKLFDLDHGASDN